MMGWRSSIYLGIILAVNGPTIALDAAAGARAKASVTKQSWTFALHVLKLGISQRQR